MDNENHANTELFGDSSYIEGEIKKKYDENINNISHRYALTASSIVIPSLKDEQQSERNIDFLESNNPDKRLLYMMIIAAYNYAFLDESAPLSAKGIVSRSSFLFVEWLNRTEISNRYNILKDYESYRFDLLNNHGGYSALIPLRTIFFYALERSNELRVKLEPEDLQYLQSLSETKISPNLNKKQDSLASYFGGLDWLRREDIGVGKELYQILASPKLTMKSFKLTISTIMIELYKYKLTLKKFLLDIGFDKNTYIYESLQKESKYFRSNYIGERIYYIINKYHQIDSNKTYLHTALELVLLSNVTNKKNYLKLLPALESEERMRLIFEPKRNNGRNISADFTSKVFVHSAIGSLFSIDHLMSLINPCSGMQSTKLETLMFSWLMASLAVQPSGIKKLTRSSFCFLKVGGKVTHIECEYFKSRSGAIHHTRSLSTKKPEGKALYFYLSQYKGEELDFFNGGSPTISTGLSSISGMLFGVLSMDSINERIIESHKQQGHVPCSFSAALKALSNGKHTENIVFAVKNTPIEERRKLVAESDSPCPKQIFGLQAIKNSSVHAYSDPYTLDFLVNRNSHTNKTEKKHYLNADNEEWINSSGRITRSVMFDLINNVFNLDLENLGKEHSDEIKEKFNSEFASLRESLSYKSGEMLSRLKIVTDQKRGKINDVGVLSLSDQSDFQGFEPIYVLDSPVTVFRILNYRYEFSKNYKKLASSNPEFLFRTAMPTIEWMEHVLDRLSKKSLVEGNKMFNQMRENGTCISVFHSM
ncbi:hypothetical protein D8T65_01245 [Vibrio vulnificus]|uniref:hypothetical protein n=1 Tax=Vibrio vulnificus TaxID=672 RepID=UPI001029B388|nr:hypothetical protein [Vibrio vulnificus]RZQ05465.1 hypothetical protein D8T65_01245 [Vibrio vulnificus]